MTPQELDQLLQAFARQRPFRPFVLEFTSGQQVQVTHPEAASWWGPFYLYVGPDRSRFWFVAASVCRVLLPAPPT